MIICTRSLDVKVKKAFGKQNVGIVSPETITKKLALDPALEKPVVDVYIVGNADLRNAKVKEAFLQAAANKHPAVNIIYYVRNGKADVQEGNGINRVMVQPSPEELAMAVENMVSQIQSKEGLINTSVSMQEEEPIPSYEPPVPEIDDMQESFDSLPDDLLDDIPSVEESIPELEPEVLPEIEMPAEEPIIQKNNGSEMVERIKECQTVTDLQILTKQMTASEVVKDIIKDNKQYVAVEEKLKGLQNKIYAIFADESLKTMEEKLDKVSAILMDKDYYRTQNNSLIEQRVEEIINTIVNRVRELVNVRLNELDRAILNTKSSGENIDFAKLAGITDERANLLLEITTLTQEVNNIYTKTDSLATETASHIASTSADLTGMPLVDAHLRMNHSSIVSSQSYESMINILSTADNKSEEFKTALRDLQVMYRKLDKLIDLDKESISALTQVIAYLRANNIEDTVIAETLIKKSMRVFVAEKDSGKTAIPFILSKLKSRENADVLYMDLSGSSKLSNYGAEAISLGDWLENGQQKDYLAVVGTPSTDPEDLQRLLVKLTKAADHYRVINIVMTPEQKELFDALAQDVLVVNYIVQPTTGELEKFNKLIKETRRDNVAQRVIINKCDVPTRPILEKLGVMDSIDIHVARIPYVPQLIECSLTGVQPWDLTVVKEAFQEVSSVC